MIAHHTVTASTNFSIKLRSPRTGLVAGSQHNVAVFPAMLNSATAQKEISTPVQVQNGRGVGVTSQTYSRNTLDASIALAQASEDAWLTTEAIKQRKETLGLNNSQAVNFMDNCEFVSLGSFCAVAKLLECLGVKRYAYPLDWVRSPVVGVLRLLDNKFEDFLTFSFKGTHKTGDLFGGSTWGGSFWHHDPSSEMTKLNMGRRVERLFGDAEVPPSQPRVFVRAANSTAELAETLHLRQALQRALPRARVYLLVLVDLQKCIGPYLLEGQEDLIFWRVDAGLHTTGSSKWSMEHQSEAYAEALAFAIRVWSGDGDVKDAAKSIMTLPELTQIMDPYDAGDAASSLWNPKPLPLPLPLFQALVKPDLGFSSEETYPPASPLPNATPPSPLVDTSRVSKELDATSHSPSPTVFVPMASKTVAATIAGQTASTRTYGTSKMNCYPTLLKQRVLVPWKAPQSSACSQKGEISRLALTVSQSYFVK